MACWSDLPMELRLMIFKVKRHNHFNERKDQLSELFKERTVKIIETEDETEVYIYIENKRCPSRLLRSFFTKIIYCEYKTDASVETTVLLMCHTSRLAIDVYNYERNQGVTRETIVDDWKALLAHTRKSLYNSYEKQSYWELKCIQHLSKFYF